MRKFLLSVIVLSAATLQTMSNSASAQNAGVTKAFEQAMLAGGSFATSPCEDFTNLFNGTSEQQAGKVKADQLRLAMFGWFEGYMEGFRVGAAYSRPEWVPNLTGLKLTKMIGELKDYCATHNDWALLLAAGRVSLQIAQDTSGRYK